MNPYRCKGLPFTGSDYKIVYKKAMEVFKVIKTGTKRKPHLKSAFFKADKVFFDHFWNHIRQKRYPDRIRRLRYFGLAVELISHSKLKPDTMTNPNKKSETLHRFYGITPNREVFSVQIKESKSGTKQLMSIFPNK